MNDFTEIMITNSTMKTNNSVWGSPLNQHILIKGKQTEYGLKWNRQNKSVSYQELTDQFYVQFNYIDVNTYMCLYY